MNNSNLKLAGAISGFSFLLGILFNYFFVDKLPGISVLVYVLFVMGGLAVILKYSGKALHRDALWLMAPLFFFSLMVAVRASEVLTFFNVMATLGLLLLIAEISFGAKLINFFIFDYFKIVFLPFKFLAPLWNTLSTLAAERRQKEKTAFHIIKGILIAAPFLIVFLLLFSSADLVFNKYISNLISFRIDEETVARTILVIIVSLAFIGAYSYIFGERTGKGEAREARGRSSGILGKIESHILFGSVNLLFLLFIIIQVTYFFGGESNIISGGLPAQAGFTYADYARRGFFELITVAIISLVLLLLADQFVSKENGGHALAFKFYSAALICQVLVIMMSAFSRLSLYEAAYGFTVQRLFSHSFIILLAVIFLMLAWKTLAGGGENYFALGAFVAINLFVFGLNLLNPDAFIARRNLERYTSTGKLDAVYLGSLSDDAMPQLIEAANTNDIEIKSYLGKILYHRGIDESNNVWQSWNISRRSVARMLAPKIGEFEKYKDYQIVPGSE